MQFNTAMFNRGSNNLEKLTDKTHGFSGSEIEEIIVSALYDAFDNDKELEQEHLESVIKTMIPLSKTMEDQIKGIRDWAKLRARRSSAIEWEDEIQTKRQLEIDNE